jgi:hypothetical protein
MGLDSWLTFNKKAVSKLVGSESFGEWLYNAKYVPKMANIFVRLQACLAFSDRLYQKSFFFFISTQSLQLTHCLLQNECPRRSVFRFLPQSLDTHQFQITLNTI